MNQGIWWLLAALVVAEVPALVVCCRWFWQDEPRLSHRAGGVLPRTTLLSLYRNLVRLLLTTLPAMALELLVLFLWKTFPAISWLVTLVLVPTIVGLLLIGAVLVATGQTLVCLARNWPRFRCIYLLPDDADQVRLHAARQGILAAATVYPQELYRDLAEIEAVVRGGQAALKARHFPKQRQFWRFRLTNDFAAYCDVFLAAYVQGYKRFFAECQEAIDHLEAIRARFRQDQALAAEQQLLDTYAQRYLAVS